MGGAKMQQMRMRSGDDSIYHQSGFPTRLLLQSGQAYGIPPQFSGICRATSAAPEGFPTTGTKRAQSHFPVLKRFEVAAGSWCQEPTA